MRPSCPSSVSTGRNEMAMTRRAKKVGPATSFTADITMSRCLPGRPSFSQRSSFLWVCSTTTIDASISSPECYCDTGKRHDIDADAHHAQGDERQQHCRRHSYEGNGGAWEMPQKYQYDEYDSDDHFDDRLLHAADGAMNQLRTV